MDTQTPTLAEARARAGLTREELAVRAVVSSRSIQRWESQGIWPSRTGQRLRLERALGLRDGGPA